MPDAPVYGVGVCAILSQRTRRIAKVAEVFGAQLRYGVLQKHVRCWVTRNQPFSLGLALRSLKYHRLPWRPLRPFASSAIKMAQVPDSNSARGRTPSQRLIASMCTLAGCPRVGHSGSPLNLSGIWRSHGRLCCSSSLPHLPLPSTIRLRRSPILRYPLRLRLDTMVWRRSSSS